MSRKYVLGIDLGTTNCVLACAALDGDSAAVQLVSLPQLVDHSVIESRHALPAFAYLAPAHESAGGEFDLPWAAGRSFAVGELARAAGADHPERTVTAAKSWLCHSRIDRRQAILPWNAPDEVAKISPVTASRYYIEHLVAAWNAANPDAPVAEQKVVLTVPASFDAAARELTREAAFAAGLPEDLILLEEPQAAVYAWMAAQGDHWRKHLQVGDRLLVCDVGGGTTDLTLAGVTESDGEVTLQRLAVGNHLLVGGDNMDLALAHFAASRFAEQGVTLDPWQTVSLWHAGRQAKETLLAPSGPTHHTISILGRGSRLIGGTVTIDVDRDEIAQLIVDGFFPKCQRNERPQPPTMSGFREVGLPYEQDTAITRHIAAFLAAHAGDDATLLPTHVLFNGGVFKADLLQQRLLDTFTQWGGDAPAPQMLAGTHDLDHAVAHGAAYYGWAKEHGGVRIRGGTARSYYVGIETAGLAIPGAPRPLHALCVVPFGMEEGTEIDVPSGDIGLVLGQPAHFRFFSSAVRKQDQAGDRLTAADQAELLETDSLETTLAADESCDEPYVPVRFQSRITELGVFELWCVSAQTNQQWKLEFSIREER